MWTPGKGFRQNRTAADHHLPAGAKKRQKQWITADQANKLSGGKGHEQQRITKGNALGIFFAKLILVVSAAIVLWVFYTLIKAIFDLSRKRARKKAPKNTGNVGVRGAIDPAFLEAYDILEAETTGPVHKLVDGSFRMHLLKAEYTEARKMLQSLILPDVDKATYQKVMNAGGGESWADVENIKAAGLCYLEGDFPLDTIQLGSFPPDGDPLVEILFSGEGHLLTIAPTGAGKGQRYILPNTFTYKGPLLCIDPKGENYRENAWRRSLHGKVYKFAPFEEDTDHFNPLDFINNWEEAKLLTDLLIVPSGQGEPFWDLSAQSLVRGLIMFVKKAREPELQNLREVCRLLSPSEKDRGDMLDQMKTMDDERFLELANEIEDMSENLRKSIYAVANSHMQPWRDERIAKATSQTTKGWHPGSFYERMEREEQFAEQGVQKIGPYIDEDGTLIRGMVDSVFLILPPSEITSYGAVLRVILGLHISGIQKKSSELKSADNSFRPKRSVLFLLDELPQLGYMAILENAVAIARSAGIKLWFFSQDLAQLRQTYPKWESILSNCKVQIYFKPGDLGTAEYLSRRLGLRKDILGGTSPLASPQQLMGTDFDGKVLIIKSGTKPIKAKQPTLFFEDESFQNIIAREKRGEMAVPRRERDDLEGN